MRLRLLLLASIAVCLIAVPGLTRPSGRTVTGWLNWRGPHQDGTSNDKPLPDMCATRGSNEVFEIDLAGRGTPVIANGRLYAMAYDGEGPDLQEMLVCLDADTGHKRWERRFNDYLSDIIYTRYTIGSPVIDPETGNVYSLTSAGVFSCFTPDGQLVWQHAMMEEFGRLTFPNGRTGGPLIDDDLVITRGITSNWGGEGPAMDRLYAFDKKSGGLVWSSSPGERPKDNSFAMPVLGWREGKRVLYTGDGSGNIVCINVRTGVPIWRFPLSAGGVNSSVVLHNNAVIAIHNDENLDTSDIGRMVAVRIDLQPKKAETGTPLLEPAAEVWRNELSAISSSPVIVGDRVYQVTHTGSLCCVDANTGKVLWRHKLAPDQLHASPVFADGKLYVPMQNGSFYIIQPMESDAKELCKVQLEGNCLGAPAIWNRKIYVLTTKKLYCFGTKDSAKNGRDGTVGASNGASRPNPGKPVALQIIPAEILVRPGEKVAFTIRSIDENGFVTGSYDSAKAKWAKYIPPTARVRAEMNAEFNDRGELVASNSPEPSAGAFEATIDDLKGYIRGRILPAPPQKEDFESYALSVPHETETGVKFAYPPLPWIGARFKWEVRQIGDTKALTKTLDNIFFQRATVFFGRTDSKNYTIEADVMSDGNRRTMSTVGLINQRYLISLLGNSQEIEVSSNQERVKASVPFAWQPKVWYHLKTRVDVGADGSGKVLAKAWKRGDPEPDAWTIEVPHKHAHTNGSPGIFGFAPQSLFRVYVDNISVTPN